MTTKSLAFPIERLAACDLATRAHRSARDSGLRTRISLRDEVLDDLASLKVWHSIVAPCGGCGERISLYDGVNTICIEYDATHDAYDYCGSADDRLAVAAIEKARAEAAVSDAACYAALDEAERHDEQELARRSNGRLY